MEDRVPVNEAELVLNVLEGVDEDVSAHLDNL